MQPGFDLFLHPMARELFVRFPLALGLFTEGGALVAVNGQFRRLLGSGSALPQPLQDILLTPEEDWRRVSVSGAYGAIIEVSAQSILAGARLILVIDESPRGEPGAETVQLRARIEELERLSSTDHLTGAWNRAHLDRVIRSEMGRSARFRQPLSLILLDIDHFKLINDTHGHAAGDEVLKELVKLITSSIRSADLMFRWGGEEFVVLAVSTPYRRAAILADILRERVENHAFSIGRVTVSLGVAELDAAESAAAWFSRLDAALYQAKEGGRNRVVTDHRGSSDAWSSRSVDTILHLSWQDDYECGEPTIDGQHRELFDLANALISASLSLAESPEGFQAAFQALLKHLEMHFADEERILAGLAYDGLEAHHLLHLGLLQRAREIEVGATTDAATLGKVVGFLVNDVVARHLLSADREFFPLFLKHGTGLTPEPSPAP